MVSPTPILFPAAFECRRHLTKGGRERGVGDKRGVVFTWRETDDATAANERKSITRCRPPPPRLHASAPPPSAFPFSRARVFSRFLLADWQRPARGSSFLVERGILELRLFSFSRASGGSYRQIFFFFARQFSSSLSLLTLLRSIQMGWSLILLREHRERREGRWRENVYVGSSVVVY